MDQRRGRIAEDISEIVHTRTAISEKLDLLEQRVNETVQGARQSVEEMVDHARDTADHLLDRAKYSFDPTYQVHHRPWMMVGAAIAAGYVLGLLEARAVSQAQGRRGVYPYYPPQAESEGAAVPTEQGPSNIWADLAKEFSGEIEHAKRAMVEAGRSFVHDLFQQLIPAVGAAFGTSSREHETARPPQHSRPRQTGSPYEPIP